MTTSHPLLGAALVGASFRDREHERDFWTKQIPNDAEVATEYIRYSTTVSVNNRIVFYETMSGDRMNDSPLAMFEYLRSHPEYGTYLHVWSINDDSTVPEQHRNLDDVVFTRRGTASYAYFLACAGQVICNTTLPMYFCRRDRQKYLNTWHGIPYKALGKDMPRARFGGSTAASANLLKATHVISPCVFMTNAIASAYSMNGVSGALIGETGYPRIDLTLNVGSERQAKLRARIGLETDPLNTRPVVLYAPTWRWQGGETVVDTDQITKDLDALSALDAQLLYRGHHRIAKLIEDQAIGEQASQILTPPPDINSNELLAVVDILVTDYSSIFFDFLPTGRPIVHNLYDMESYAESQGLYLEVDDLPGVVTRNREQLVDAVLAAAASVRELPSGHDLSNDPLQGKKYALAQQRFWPHEDGHSSGRAVDFFFNDQTDQIQLTSMIDERPSRAYWAGPLDNSLETEGFLIQASRQEDPLNYQTAVIFEHRTHVGKKVLRWIKAVRAHSATVTCKSETPVLLESERQAYGEFVNRGGLGIVDVAAALQSSETLRRIFEREYRRQLSKKRFDIIHLAPGLNNHELALVAIAIGVGDLSERISDMTIDDLEAHCRARTIQYDNQHLRLVAMTDRLEVAQDRAEKLQIQVKRLQDRASRQKKANVELRTEVAQMRESTSWKITRPLRAVKWPRKQIGVRRSDS